MCLNSRGKMTTDKIFFQKIFRRGENDKEGKMTEGITVIVNFMILAYEWIYHMKELDYA